MAPPPEYDKEPKAPDKSVTNISTDDSKVLYNLVKEQQNNSDHKPSNVAANADIENNKHVGTLDDGQLRALLDEAIAYKRPKDREGKSSLFKELLEEVEQDEQACEAAARSVTGRRVARGCGGGGGGPHGRRALPHSNSLQDLMAAALAAEPPRQRAHAHPPPATVSARAHHGGSLPSGVDTSFMLSEEPTRGGYLATVRCVNPPPLAERRVSASDANAPAELEHINRRSKPMFPVTYTARATLEIGSGSVCSGRAVTTTTPSNQVRTPPSRPITQPPHRTVDAEGAHNSYISITDPRTKRLMNALKPRTDSTDKERKFTEDHTGEDAVVNALTSKANIKPDGTVEPNVSNEKLRNLPSHRDACSASKDESRGNISPEDDHSDIWMKTVDNWYEGLSSYFVPNDIFLNQNIDTQSRDVDIARPSQYTNYENKQIDYTEEKSSPSIDFNQQTTKSRHKTKTTKAGTNKECKQETRKCTKSHNKAHPQLSCPYISKGVNRDVSHRIRLVVPNLAQANPRNFRNTTIGNIEEEYFDVIDKSGNVSDSINSKEEKKEDCNNKDKKITEDKDFYELKDMISSPNDFEIELVDCASNKIDKSNSFPQFVEEQRNLFKRLEHIEHFSRCTPKRDIETFKELRSDDPIRKDNKVVSHSRHDNLNDSESKNSFKSKLLKNNNTTLTHINDPTNINIRNIVNSKEGSNEIVKEESEKSMTNIPDMEQIVAKCTSDKKTKKTPLTMLLIKNLFQKDQLSRIELSKEVDSAIPFSCITTPEVVASCNTTTAHSALAIDPKPLQLGSCYRAVSCLTGEPPTCDAPLADTATPHPPPGTPTHEQPRSVISSSLNGLPLTRPGFAPVVASAAGATGASANTTTADDCKKSLDENGNSVQGFSSPLSGSSHNKKPRRKKSSKNETVIKSQEIDGYQGNKDLNEVLRFIESNADSGRGNKVRAKHKDDDDKPKKRSTERRKDKESKVKRASSLEELSRTKLEDLTDKPAPRPDPAKPKPERRSWGEDAREPRDLPEPALELTDFQTVTKKRKPRRRADDPEPPRRARAPPAPPSDRSNDSNDDMDSVHSLHSLPADAPPARPAPAAPHASYADIARTRHNIPDLIESCNFYESEAAGEPKRAEPAPAAAPAAGDDYPALETRKKRDKPRASRKERAEGDAPAPDVVSDRRPAVILLDRTSRPRDMDGVTFGFDINEQLVGSRRPRCDLLRDALEGAVAVPVRAGALRYMPPHAPHDTAHLLQIVDYVGAAWEDVVRCGGGKVRYFSE